MKPIFNLLVSAFLIAPLLLLTGCVCKHDNAYDKMDQHYGGK